MKNAISYKNSYHFEFLDNQWNLVRLAFLISSAVTNFHQKRYNNGDFKENCRKLAEMILPVLQQGTKRSANRDFQSR